MSILETTRSTHQVVMFVDIAGSTALYEALGDERARELTTRRLEVLATIARDNNGRIAAELGDELMCFFAQPGDAAACACQIHARLAELAQAEPGVPPVAVRIGMHYGPGFGRKEDLSEETAKLGHWAARNAKPEQTLATEPVVAALPRIYKAVSRYVDDETWNFVSLSHLALYEIIWDVEAVTACAVEETGKPEPKRYEAVELSSAHGVIRVNAERPVVSVGRAQHNDLMLVQDFVSRQHFSAQFSRGRCTITDKSTNGTLVIPRGGERHLVKRETYPLHGDGVIVLGEPGQDAANSVIYYVCR
ncbi:MAG: adenylate/guanylate cyclase domain-containing protein [Gammaproteobacteria bacterium]|nr:adenylate/guanylate cyclase domain-containing protein [Gammaproteobacteria bacterium]MBI5618958.1 adenylate/guanylate cyclase domain-containing protein [Gammaproteobacteria bacterium]